MTRENKTSSIMDHIMTEPKDNPSFDEIVNHLHQMGIKDINLKKEDINFAKIRIDWDKTVNIEVLCASGGSTLCEVFHPACFSSLQVVTRPRICIKTFHKEAVDQTFTKVEIPNSLSSVETIFSREGYIAFTGTFGGYCLKDDGSIGPIPR